MFVATCCLVVCTATKGQVPPVKKTIAQDLGQTFGFCYGQRLSLAHLREKFPDLEPQIVLTELQWNNAFKEAEEGVELRLQTLLSDQWSETRSKMIAQFEPTVTEQNLKATHDQATRFLEIVQQRAKGGLDSPTREMLLASHPKFVKSPELEFISGYTGIYSSKDHPKAKGVEVTLRYPLSWKQMEADRPNIVQKWTSDGGHGNDIFMLLIKKFPTTPTPDEAAAMFTELSAKEILGEGELVSYTTSKLEKLPIGIIQFKQAMKRLDITMEARGVCYYLICEDSFILLQLMCYSPGEPEKGDLRVKQLEPLLRLMVNSVVLPGTYK